jgi:ATP-dependent helicase/DNAse subunit B
MGAGEKGNSWSRLAYIQGSSGNPFDEPRGAGTAITREQLESLLAKTEEKLVEAGRRIISGDVAVAPSRHGKNTACSYCSFGAICGIDYRLNRAVLKPSAGRRDILARLEEDA